jgi:VanZ family protein
MNFKNKVQYWFPVVLWISFIFWMSTGMFSAENTYSFFAPLLRFLAPSISPREIVIFHMILRKMAHVTEYFISGLLLFRAFRDGSGKTWKWNYVFYSLLVIVVIAAGDEFHQTFVANRTPSYIDVGIDIFGGFLAQSFNVLRYRRRRQ